MFRARNIQAGLLTYPLRVREIKVRQPCLGGGIRQVEAASNIFLQEIAAPASLADNPPNSGSDLMNLFQRLLNIFSKSDPLPAQGRTSTPLGETLLHGVYELSLENPRAKEAAENALSGQASGDEDFHDLMTYCPKAGVICYALEKSGLLARVDWAEEASEVVQWFEEIFERAGIAWSQDESKDLVEKADKAGLKRGEAVGFVYLAAQSRASKVGFEILDINTGSDQHAFFAVPKATAAKWRFVDLGQGMRIENPDWQFKKLASVHGFELTYPAHPKKSLRPFPLDL
ncbi:hypothetical protein [Leisingera daeponensis]|uniref:DUF6630 family protein n=1 Tax=Leisingera daeponensis TaxID=405746 RepID=UPI001C93CE48|nr:hypothetical protein [Leisingera daeponensis]MBY6055772.1 hypothetical protein [Leisingera daeponensis]